MPSEKNDTVLSAREFRDGLALCYNKPLLALPGVCDGCGKSFSLDHGLNCPNGGNIIRRHNEVRDVAGQLASMAYSHVTPLSQLCGSKVLDPATEVAWCVIWRLEECGIHRRKWCLILKSSTRMPTPTSTALYEPSLSLLLQWRGASTRKRARISEPTSLHLYAQRTERSTAKASISWNASLPVWPQSGTWPILELWASFVNACPSQFFGHQSTAFGAPGESSFLSPLNLEPRWL